MSGDPERETSSVNWAQLRFHLKTETEFSLRNVMCVLSKNRGMYNVQKHDPLLIYDCHRLSDLNLPDILPVHMWVIQCSLLWSTLLVNIW
jgi:hypothetical protein